MATYFINTQQTQFLTPAGTPNNVVILANAEQVTDAGRISEWYDSSYLPTSGYSASYYYALNMTGANPELTIGGDYSAGYANPYNIYMAVHTAHQTAVGVHFDHNATVSLNAQTGAALASQNDDGHLRFGAYATAVYDKPVRSSSPGPVDASATTFQANGGTITYNGDIVGRTEAGVAGVKLTGVKIPSASSTTYVSLSKDNTLAATGIQARSLVIGNNVNSSAIVGAVVSATEIRAYGDLITSGNTVVAQAIQVESDVTLDNGQNNNWGGSIVAVTSDTLLTATTDNFDSEAKVSKTAAVAANNVIGAYGVKAGGSIQVAHMDGAIVSASIGNAQLLAETDGMPATSGSASSSGSAAATTLTMNGNTLTAMAMQAGGTIRLDSVDDTTQLGAGILDTVISANQVSTASKTLTFTGNRLKAHVLDAGSIELGDFDGRLSAETSDLNVQLGNWNTASISFVTTTAGMYASDAITVSGDLAGNIQLTISGNQSSVLYSTTHSLLQHGYGLFGKTLTVNGQFISDISVTCVATPFNFRTHVFGIRVEEKVIAAALSGKITVNASGINPTPEMEEAGYEGATGIQAGFISVYADDAFDVNGTISATTYGIRSGSKLNMRVSGEISADKAAIMTEHWTEENNSIPETYVTATYDDKLELGDTAVIHGAIDLRAGQNELTIYSGAEVHGNLRASTGQLNIVFMLNENNSNGGHAMVNTDLVDISLTGNKTLTINLNSATLNSSYKLFSYSTDVSSYWSSMRVAFVCNGEEYKITLDGGHGAVTVNDVSVAINLVGGNQVVVTTGAYTGSGAAPDTIGDLAAFSGVIREELTGDGNLKLKWNTMQLNGSPADLYEIEYQVYDASGSPVGKSVTVTVTGDREAPEQEFELSALSLNSGEQVEYRMRASSGGNKYLSQWTGWGNQVMPTIDPAANTPVMTPDSGRITSLSSESGGITSPNVQFSWGSATTGLAIARYELLYFESEDELDIASSNWSFNAATGVGTAVDDNGGSHNTYHKIATGTSAVATELTNQQFVYWAVRAVDTAGNKSGFINGQTFRVWTGDTTAPQFTGASPAGIDNVVMNNSEPYAVKYGVTFWWTPATDLQSGVYQYVVEYKLTDETEWKHKSFDNDVFSYAIDAYGNDALAGGLYEYRIYAVDYVGNQSAYAAQGRFGNADVTPPDGAFTGYSASVATTFTIPTTTTTTKDASGKTVTVTTTGAKVYTSVTATMNWRDTFTDASDLVYTVEVCNNALFSGNVYTFTTTEKSLSLSMGSTGNSVAVLNGMDTVYWRVSVADSAGNVNPTPSATQSFSYRDEEGDLINLSYAPAAPTNLRVSTSGSRATFRWSDAADLGSYRFELTYSYTYVDPNDGTTKTATKTIGDISGTSYTVTDLTDSNYTWSVASLSGPNSAKKSTRGEAFVIDTVAPTDVKNVKSVSIKNNVLFSWNASTDVGSGLAHYILEYKIRQAEVYSSLTVAGTSYLAAFNSTGTYDYRIYAVDKAGNRSTESVGSFSITPGADLGDTIADATPITLGQPLGENQRDQTIGSPFDLADYVKFSVAAASEVEFTISNLADVSGSGSGVTVKLYDASGKAIGKTVSIKSTAGSGVCGMFLESGDYYLGVTPQKSSVISQYNLFGAATAVPINNSDDTPAGAQDLQNDFTFSGGTVTTTSDWIGYGDEIDYYTFTIDRTNADGAWAGKYSFTLNDFISGNAVVTLYRTLADGTIQKVKGQTATDRAPSFTVADLLDGVYYVAVSSADAKNALTAKTSFYTLTVTAEETYPQYGGGSAAMTVNRNEYASYTVSGAKDNYVLAFTGVKYTVYTDNGKGGFAAVTAVNGKAVVDGGTTLYFKSTADNNPITVNEIQGYSAEGGVLILGTDATGWVGGSNAEDSWQIAGIAADQWMDFGVTVGTSSLDNVAKFTVTVYRKVKGVWQKYISNTVQSGKPLTLGASLLAGETYKLTVSGGTVKNAGEYIVTSSQGVVYDNSNDTPATADLLTFAGGASVAVSGWVGYGDEADYYTFTVASTNNDGVTAGKYSFALEAGSFTSGSAAVTLYRALADGTVQKVKNAVMTDKNPSFTVDNLLDGVYYVAVTSANAKNMASPKNTGYTLNVAAVATYSPVVSGDLLAKNEYATYTVGNAKDNYVLEFTGAKYTVYTDNGKGGFAALSLVNGKAVVDGGQVLYVKSTADSNPFTVGEIASYDDEAGALTIGTAAAGWVGGSNAEDVWTFSIDAVGDAESVAFALNGGAVSLGASAKLTMTLYQYVASSDSWRKCASTTSQTGKNGSFEMLLGAGSYKVAVSGGTAKNAAEYTLTSTVARTVTMLAFAQGAATSGAGHVGAAGSLDYYAFTVKQSNADGATAGKYTFALTAGSFTSGNAAVTLYRTWADGSIQKVKSLTVTDRNLSFSVGDLLEGTYYVAVESVKGKESDYTLTVTADDTYDRLTDGVPGAIDRNQYASFTVGNAEDNYVLEFTGAKYTVYTDNGKGGFAAVSTVKGRAVVDGGTTLYIKSTADANPITVDELVGYSAEGGVLTIGTAATGWVGGSNAEDTWTVAGYGDGWSKFTVDLTGSLDNTARLTFTINQLVNGVWRKYASCTGQSGKTASFGVSLDPGTAYQLVVSGGTARNAAAYTVTGIEYLYDYSNNLFEDATVLSAGDTVADKVLVKNFDDVDFYDLGNLADGNLFSWQQSEGSAKLSFYDENYKLVAVTADITDSKGVVSKKANTFTLSAAVSLAFDDYSASGVKYVKAEAAANGGSIYQLALGA